MEDEIARIVTGMVRWEGVSSQTIEALPKFLQLHRDGNCAQMAYIVFMNEVGMRGDPVSLGVYCALLEGVGVLKEVLAGCPNSVTDSLALGSTLLVLQHFVPAVLCFIKRLNGPIHII